MRPEPKFVPGELVGTAGTTFDAWNGLQGKVVSADFRTGFSLSAGRLIEGWAYALDIGGPARLWSEHNLRKLPGNLLGDMSSLASIWTPKLDEVKA